MRLPTSRPSAPRLRSAIIGLAFGAGPPGHALARLVPPIGASAASAAPVTLPVVKVNAARVRDASTEGSGSYAPSAVTLGKDHRTLRETPHSVTVLTREQLNDQNIVNIEGALKNVTGVTVQRFDATGSYTQFIARGYAADSYQLDGLNVQTDANGIYFDLAAYDRVEVQRGAAGLFSGAGEPGVTVNIARKRAQSTPHAEAAMSFGSWKDRRLDVDVTGALNAAGSFRGRAVAVVENFDTFMDGIDGNKKRLLYGTLEADVGPRTTLSVGATWQHVKTVLSRGLPAYASGQLIDMPRSTMPVLAWNRQTLDSSSAFAEVEHRGSNDSSLKLAWRRLSRGNDAAYIDPAVPAGNGTMTGLATSAFAREDTDNTADVYYRAPVEAFGQKHNLLIGVDYRKSRNEVHYAGYLPVVGSFNLFRFDPYAIPEPAFNLEAGLSEVFTTSTGAYSQLRFKPVKNLTLIGGGRFGSWKSEGISYGTPVSYQANHRFVPNAAAIYDIDATLSLYGSYNEIFKPQNAVTFTGEQIKPRTGRQFETGIKGDASGGRFTWSAAVYRLSDENRSVADDAHINFSVATGKARTQGIELDFRGELTPQWSMSGGYAFTDTEYLRAEPALVGTAVSSITPRHNFNLWTRYRMGSGQAKGLIAGFGLRGMSDFFNGSGSQRVRGPGYTLFSLNLAYPVNERLRVSLNVDNLFDKIYWEKVGSPSRQNFFGEPRRITLALRSRF